MRPHAKQSDVPAAAVPTLKLVHSDCVQGRPLGKRLQGISAFYRQRTLSQVRGRVVTCPGCHAQVLSTDRDPLDSCPACHVSLMPDSRRAA